MEQREGWTVRLARRPVGPPTADCFEVGVEPAEAPGPGEVLVENYFLSVDPYMRGRMSDAKSYAAPYEVGAIMLGGAVGRVVESRHADLPVGASVVHDLGWRDWATGPASVFRAVDVGLGPLSAFLGALGMTGLTAYAGIVDVADVRPGDTVYVSGAAGAVGGIAGQIARLRGAGRVVGSAGSPEKVSYLIDELGFDDAFNYRDGAIKELLRHHVGKIDVFFDNVGGEQLEAAISAMNPFGRIASCGAISNYNQGTPPPGPRNLGMLTGKRLTLRGFLVGDYEHRRGEFERAMSSWLADGRVRAAETFVDGVGNTPDAFLGLFTGRNTGKMVVRAAAAVREAPTA
ncbi:MAG: NADP-dependent oxidoreductase [Acidobacteriota bacterium]|nr:NADP-dependent oxidoreductase [Acidobacteriota bacterium]